MSGDWAKDPAPGDFTTVEPSCPDALVVFLTEYGITATAEEIDRMLLRVYGPDRVPGTESRRRSQMGESPRQPDPHGACEQCGEPLTWGVRFCSQDCWREWLQDQRPPPPTHAEMLAEMREAYARLVEELAE